MWQIFSRGKVAFLMVLVCFWRAAHAWCRNRALFFCWNILLEYWQKSCIEVSSLHFLLFKNKAHSVMDLWLINHVSPPALNFQSIYIHIFLVKQCGGGFEPPTYIYILVQQSVGEFLLSIRSLAWTYIVNFLF